MSFSIRGLLVCTFAVSCAFALLSYLRRQEADRERLVERARGCGVLVYWDWQYDADEVFDPNIEGPIEGIGNRLLGRYYGSSIVAVAVDEYLCAVAGADRKDVLAVLPLLLADGRDSIAWGNFDFADDRTMEALSRLPRLRSLGVMGFDVTDAGILHLKSCKSLERLDEVCPNVSAKALEELHRALPSCQIRGVRVFN